MVRGSRRKVLVSATLENRKENAYNTSLSLSFSRNLHLSSLTPQRDSQVKVECTAPSPHARLCSVGHPVFQTGAKVTFLLEFEFSCSFLLSQVLVRLTATSDSLERNGTLQDNIAQTSAYIQYEPQLLFSSSEPWLLCGQWPHHLGPPSSRGPWGQLLPVTVSSHHKQCELHSAEFD